MNQPCIQRQSVNNNSLATHALYSSIFDHSQPPSSQSQQRASILLESLGSMLPPPPPIPPENIYALTKANLAMQQHQQASSVPVNEMASLSLSGQQMLQMSPPLDEHYNHVLNGASLRLNRYRKPSNSSTVSTTRSVSGMDGLQQLAAGKGATITSSNPLNIFSTSQNIVGDRNSFSLIQSVNIGNSGGLFEVKWIRCSKDGSPGSPITDVRKVRPDDYRLIRIERSSALLGIRILRTTKSKGVFVQMVTEGSLASQADIKVGDQIIEICGINMRTADYENAAKVLNQCGDSIQMLVQYNLDKFKEILALTECSDGTDSVDSCVPGIVVSCTPSNSAVSNNAATLRKLHEDMRGKETHRSYTSSLSAMATDGTDQSATDDNESMYDVASQADDIKTRRRRRTLTAASSSGGGSCATPRNTSSPANSELISTASRRNTLTNEDNSTLTGGNGGGASSTTSTLTRQSKVASLPHECSLLSGEEEDDDPSSSAANSSSSSASPSLMSPPQHHQPSSSSYASFVNEAGQPQRSGAGVASMFSGAVPPPQPPASLFRHNC